MLQENEIQLVRVAPVHTAVVRARVAAEQLSAFVPAVCGEVWCYARQFGLPAGRHVALYLTEGVVECGVEVNATFSGNDRVVCSQLPGGIIATATHLGPYALLGATHRAIRHWCAARGHRATGISWELYGHWQPEWNNEPSRIHTDVCHLLQTTSSGS